MKIEDCSAEILKLFREIKPAESPAVNPIPSLSVVAFDVEARLAIAMRDEKFKALFEGDMSEYADDHSAADLALSNCSAFFFERNPVLMDQVFRRSKLMRQKWERPDYRNRTIKLAIDGCAKTYSTADELLFFHYNDYGNAFRLISEHGAHIRFCHDFKKWIVWDGQRWEPDGAERVKRLVQMTMLKFLEQAIRAENENAAKFAKESLANRHIKDAMAMAQPNLSIRADELDQHVYLLNFKNGTVDLRTGELHAHDPKQFITKTVHHEYRPEANCPQFLVFLQTVLPDEKIRNFVQKALGYSLTADTIEKAVFIPFGTGDNGKSLLLTLFLFLLEEYSMLLQIDTLMTRQESSNSQSDLADLRGARFVPTSETEEGQRLAEGKLKRITQGMGKIKAVRKYENPIMFPETHKLWIDCNHKPVVRGTDNAIWNRLHMIPFTVTIPKDKQDRQLLAKLKQEAQGILAWSVAGAALWWKEGLGKPVEVTEAVAGWRKESEPLKDFVADCCHLEGNCKEAAHKEADHKCTVADLRNEYMNWCNLHNEKPLSSTIFNQHLESLGCHQAREKVNQKDHRIWKGICPNF